MVKLNNPQMGTETTLYSLVDFRQYLELLN